MTSGAGETEMTERQGPEKRGDGTDGGQRNKDDNKTGAERESRTEGQRRGTREDDGGQSDPLKRNRDRGTEVGDKEDREVGRGRQGEGGRTERGAGLRD